MSSRALHILCLLLALASGCARTSQRGKAAISQPPRIRQHYTLQADRAWQLDAPGGMRFDASALLLSGDGQLLTVHDRSSELFRIDLGEGASAKLVPTGKFSHAQISKAAVTPKTRYDTEGIAQDAAGNLYICEETDRAIYKYDPASATVSRLEIDWSAVKRFFSLDPNASFEGIAVGDTQLYVANERSDPRIVVISLNELRVVDDFAVDASTFAFLGPQYTDLSWFEGHLFVLDRNHRVVLQVDPGKKRVIAEFAFGAMELEPEVSYQTDFPTGTMEGLVVDAEYFWLVTDNNGLGRHKYPNDRRPTLFRCKRPDARSAALP